MAETMPAPEASALAGGDPKRVIIVLRPQGAGSARNLRPLLIGGAAVFALLVGSAIGYRLAESFVQTAGPVTENVDLVERVNGGLYALELATPKGQARWMLEFDADIITREGPSNPLELRDALEKLVIGATSLPLVQTASNPDVAMRKAILAMAKQDYPWLVDVHMRRSDIRATQNKLQSMGEAMRHLQE